MDPIEGVNLAELVAESSGELLKSKRHETNNAIKKLLLGIEDLDGRIRSAKQKVTELEAEKGKKVALVEKIKSGDWSALRVEKEQPKPEEKAQQA